MPRLMDPARVVERYYERLKTGYSRDERLKTGYARAVDALSANATRALYAITRPMNLPRAPLNTPRSSERIASIPLSAFAKRAAAGLIGEGLLATELAQYAASRPWAAQTVRVSLQKAREREAAAGNTVLDPFAAPRIAETAITLRVTPAELARLEYALSKWEDDDSPLHQKLRKKLPA